MKILNGRLCTSLILLWSLLAIAAGAAAQEYSLDRSAASDPQPTHSNPATPAATAGFKVLSSFAASYKNGASPEAGLFRDAAGNLYGTTEIGGDTKTCSIGNIGCGVVFKLNSKGLETVLHDFCYPCADGAYPQAGLIMDSAGNLYGTTTRGNGGNGYGTVFEVDNGGQFSVVYTFCTPTCGESPEAGLIEDAAGNLYGTASEGGTGGHGTVFKLAPPAQQGGTWTETVLYDFCSAPNCTDGQNPTGGLIVDAAGNFYGTTGGDANCSPSACGTVFKLDTTNQETVLYSFCSAPACTDGKLPRGGVIMDTAGNLYGTAAYGGISGPPCYSGVGGCGTVFEVDNTGQFSVLYTFCSAPSCADGNTPFAGLIMDAAGNLYGTTRYGGATADNSNGTVFKLTQPTQPGGTWTETVLHSFCSIGGYNCTDGAEPWSGLIMDASGNLYGTATGGGAHSFGTVFTLPSTPQSVKTTTALASSPNPSTYGEAVTFTAVVASSVGAPPDGEPVSFMKGKSLLGTGSLGGGSATFITSTLKVGTTSVTAVYNGDSNFLASKSKVVKQVVQ